MAHSNTRSSFNRNLAIGAMAMTMLLNVESVPAATPDTPFERRILPDIPLAAPVQVKVVKQARVTFAPGQASGAHLHPLPVIGVVTSGSFIFQIEGQAETTLRSGDSFYEPAGAKIARFDNASASEKASISAFYLAQDSREDTIIMLHR